MAGRRTSNRTWAGRRPVRRQRGAALLIFLVLLVMGALTYLINNLSPDAIKARQTLQTQETLTQAREALIGYALTYRDKKIDRMYGFLPMPDIGKRGTTTDENCIDPNGKPLEGCQAPPSPSDILKVEIDNNYLPTLVGRFPWRTLGMPPLKDGYGECLWLIVSSPVLNGNSAETAIPINWDTLGYLDIQVANGSNALQSLYSNKPHDRPLAIIYAPGPALPGQDRSKSSNDDVTECGGNYDARNYLDPYVLDALGGTRNSLANQNNASDYPNNFSYRSTNPIKITTDGTIFKSDDNLLHHACLGSNCTLQSNDFGLALTPDLLFGAIRKNANFRTDINDMLQKIADCAQDQIYVSNFTANAKADAYPTCSTALDAFGPRGYYAHYGEQVFIARCTGCQVTIDNAMQTCSGVVMLGSQRAANQNRRDSSEKANPASYLEGDNLTSFQSSGSLYTGPSWFGNVRALTSYSTDTARCLVSGQWRVSAECQTAEQDILRCIAPGPVLTTVSSPSLAADKQLSSYNPNTSTLTLGHIGVESDEGYPAHALFGCAWKALNVTGNGVRAYFRYLIHNTGTAGDGFVFALADGDANMASACGGASQLMGYAGSNGSTPSIAPPKIGIEFDTKKDYRPNGPPYTFINPPGFDPAYLGSSPRSTSYLNNGRADPDFHAAGHFGIVYWGGETPISTGLACGTGCTYPQTCIGGTCYLPADQDDNVHGRTASALNASRPPPQNPAALIDSDHPTNPTPLPALSSGLYELTPDSSVLKETWVHVRIELSRSQPRTVAAVATNNQALIGLPTIDGVALIAGSRILLTAQDTGSENGVWEVAPGTWSRAAAEDSVGKIPYGTTWQVTGGTTYADTFWRFASPEGFDPASSTNIVISQVPTITREANARLVRVVATANQGLSGLPTIDGVQMQAGDRVLLTAQTTASDNGVWGTAVGAWTRASTEDEQTDLPTGTAWIVREGNAYAWTYWRLSNTDRIAVGVSTITIAQATPPWKAVATGSITLSGIQTIGDVTLAARDWVLVAGQNATMDNGIYRVRSGAWERIPMYQETYDIRAWTQKEGVYTDRIANLKLVSRAIADLNASYVPRVADTATIYSPQADACTYNAQCPTGQWCGIDNVCYRPSFRTLRLGFTNGQGTRDQQIDITDFVSTWLP